MANILVELHDGSVGPMELSFNPAKTAAQVLIACARRFHKGTGTLSPKDKPNLALEAEDTIAGSVTYIFIPSAAQAVTQSDRAQRLGDTEARLGEIAERLAETQARVAELTIQQNRASQTTQTIQMLGAVWIQQAHKLLQLPCLVAMPEDAPEFEMACTAVLNRFTAALYSTPAQTGKVLYDIASGIGNAAKKDIAHRDVTPNNFGHWKGRGYLYDFSAAKDMAGNWDRPRCAGTLSGITGTVLWAPLSVLEGGQHSVSSMLEGLFISALSISCNGKLDSRHDMNPGRLRHCAHLRRGHLCTPALSELSSIESSLKPLITGLHDVFYPLQDSEDPTYRNYNTKGGCKDALQLDEFEVDCVATL
ncbi:MAG: hypothetical protein FRX49_07541 [Trebouxia sp. A1-2]|nr:MAG: hypothetical protein FRX49_07541 [Trebouxia sp. A1-2]